MQVSVLNSLCTFQTALQECLVGTRANAKKNIILLTDGFYQDAVASLVDTEVSKLVVIVNIHCLVDGALNPILVDYAAVPKI